jgi:hypothetical protein
MLCQLFGEAVGLERIGIDDNFFELGGHSLTAARLIVRACATVDSRLSIWLLFESPTVARLTDHLRKLS